MLLKISQHTFGYMSPGSWGYPGRLKYEIILVIKNQIFYLERLIKPKLTEVCRELNLQLLAKYAYERCGRRLSDTLRSTCERAELLKVETTF